MQQNQTPVSRRALLAGALAMPALLCGCATTEISRAKSPPQKSAELPRDASEDPELEARYAAFQDGEHLVPSVPYRSIDPQYLRQRVADPTGEQPGTVVVDTSKRFLYLVEADGAAMRYGIGVGRDGFAWRGDGVIHWRQHWPRWKPPAEMISRKPELEQYSIANGGMDPGIMNPLGARALYIFRDGQDTLYRLHGSPEWQSIGKAVSSGCVRLLNHDIVDLYDRVPYHARIVVHQEPMTGNVAPTDVAS